MNNYTTTSLMNVTSEFLELIKLPSPKGKQLRYLMVMPNIAMNANNAYRMPYGFCMVSSALKASGREVYCLNMNYKESPYDLLRDTISMHSIDVVFTGGLSGQFSSIKNILALTKSVGRDIVTCVGGGIITADPRVAMEALELADYGIFGEGEISINAFAYALENDLELGGEAGVISKNGQIGPPRKVVSDLDILPFPDYDGFEMDLLLKENLLHYRVSFSDNGFPIATSRSCPYKCTFCFHSSGDNYRRRSFDSVKKELEWVKNKYPLVGLIQFIDEIFSKDTLFLEQLTTYLKVSDLSYQVFFRVDLVTEAILRLLKDSGCQHLFLGVESADNRILKSMNKNITVDQIEQAFSLANKVGIKARGNIIFGDPKETPETIRNTINWLNKNQEYNITTAWVFTFPGTHLYNLAYVRGIIKDKVQYLKEGNMQLNLTSMPNDIYRKMILNVTLFQILSTNGVQVDFENMEEIKNTIKKTVEDMADSHKIAIWPSKYDTIAMLNELSPKFIASKNVYFVNVDPASSYVKACEQFGKQVHTPEDAFLKGDIDVVFYALGSRSIGDMVYRQISNAIDCNYHSVKNIIKIEDCVNLQI